MQTAAGDPIELSEGHVYTNPNYPTLEIGGMPFYLMPASAASPPPPAPGSSPRHHPGTGTTLGLGRDPQNPGDSKSSQSTGFYEPGGSTLSQRSGGGPIYEDIDRMCTYRGSPPYVSPPDSVPSPGKWDGARIQKGPPRSEERTYCNVPQPKSDSGEGDSSRDAHAFCGTSSSEVSFESGSSPRHHPGTGTTLGLGMDPRHHVLVNPLVSPARFRPAGPRSPGGLSSPGRQSGSSSSTRSPSSVYYYSDTLRPRGRPREVAAAASAAGLDSSDSGISSNTNHVDMTTPPPLNPLPSRAADMAAASRASGRRRGTSTGRKGLAGGGFSSANV